MVILFGCPCAVVYSIDNRVSVMYIDAIAGWGRTSREADVAADVTVAKEEVA